MYTSRMLFLALGHLLATCIARLEPRRAAWMAGPSAPTLPLALPRRSYLTTSVLFLCLIAVLGSISIVNGLWSKNLTISGVVETGDLRGDWSVIFTSDECHEYGEYPSEPETLTIQTGGGGGGYDYGSGCACPDNEYRTSTSGGSSSDCVPPCPTDVIDGQAIQTQTSGGGYDGGGGYHDEECVTPTICTSDVDAADKEPHGAQIASVKIEYATHGYYCYIKGFILNTGSIPFHIIGANTILGPSTSGHDNSDGIEFYDLNGSDTGKCRFGIESSGYADQFGVQTFGGTYNPPPTPTPSISRQVDPGKEGYVECKVKVKDAAKFGWSYYFAIEVCVAQWNEDPSTSGGETGDLAACKASKQHEGPDTPVLPVPHETSP